MFKDRKIDWIKLGMIMQSNKTDPDKVKKEYARLSVKESFNIGDYVCGDEWCYGNIIKICTDIAYINGTGGVTCFKLSELKHANLGDEK